VLPPNNEVALITSFKSNICISSRESRVRHVLFPGGTRLDALAFAGGVLPDATLRGMRMFQSHGGTVLTVAGRDLSSEASAPGSDASCRKRHAGRGADTPAILLFASAPLPRGRLQLVAGRLPRVTGLTS
jgi:hypothetical protein